jgi:serine/threonine protein kinase
LDGAFLDRHVCIRFEDGSSDTIRLFGTRVDFGDLTGTPDDVQPSFVQNSICIRESDATNGWFFACRTLRDLASLADSLCFAGCIMRDLAQHCCIARDAADHLKQILSSGKAGEAKAIPVRPTTSRAGKQADIVLLKVSIHAHQRALLLNEVQFLLTLSHVGIPQTFGIYDMKLKGAQVTAMLMDVPLTGAPLSSWIPAGGLPEMALSDLMAQLCNVLVYLENMSVLHRDVNPESVLCVRAEDGAVRVVLRDFGWATKFGEATAKSTRCGSPGFIAPELFQPDAGLEQSGVPAGGLVDVTKIDVFSFGLLICTALNGSNPFQGETLNATLLNNAKQQFNAGTHYLELNNITGTLRSLLAGLCAPDPSMRSSASEASCHPWFMSSRTRVTLEDLYQIRVRSA